MADPNYQYYNYSQQQPQQQQPYGAYPVTAETSNGAAAAAGGGSAAGSSYGSSPYLAGGSAQPIDPNIDYGIRMAAHAAAMQQVYAQQYAQQQQMYAAQYYNQQQQPGMPPPTVSTLGHTEKTAGGGTPSSPVSNPDGATLRNGPRSPPINRNTPGTLDQPNNYNTGTMAKLNSDQDEKDNLRSIPVDIADGAAGNRGRKPSRSGATTPVGIFFDYLCCCFPTSIIARWICFGIFLIICIAITVVGVLFWPKFPVIKVLAIDTNHIVGGFEFIHSSDPRFYNNLNEMTVKLNLNMTLSVFNPNSFDLNVNTLQLNAYLNVNQSALSANNIRPALLGLDTYIGPAPVGAPSNYQPNYDPNIGQASKSQIVFPAQTNITFFMNFTFSYTPDTMIGLIKDPAFAEAVNVCGVQGRARPAKISYNAVSSVATLSSIGYNPTVSGAIYINCPVSQSQIDAVTFAVQGGADPIQALTQIFNSDGGVIVSNGTITTPSGTSSGSTPNPTK